MGDHGQRPSSCVEPRVTPRYLREAMKRPVALEPPIRLGNLNLLSDTCRRATRAALVEYSALHPLVLFNTSILVTAEPARIAARAIQSFLWLLPFTVFFTGPDFAGGFCETSGLFWRKIACLSTCAFWIEGDATRRSCPNPTVAISSMQKHFSNTSYSPCCSVVVALFKGQIAAGDGRGGGSPSASIPTPTSRRRLDARQTRVRGRGQRNGG